MFRMTLDMYMPCKLMNTDYIDNLNKSKSLKTPARSRNSFAEAGQKLPSDDEGFAKFLQADRD